MANKWKNVQQFANDTAWQVYKPEDMNSIANQYWVGWATNRNAEVPSWDINGQGTPLLNKGPNDQRRQMYIDAWYTNKPGDNHFYSPTGERTNVRYDGSLDIQGDNIVGGYEPDLTVQREAERRNAERKASDIASIPTPNQRTISTPTTPIVQANPTQQGQRNANLNFQMYWDDSSPENQGTPGGMYNKYTGEGVDTSQLNYDPNITTADLGGMAFWQAGRMANTNQANYLAQRNDRIASALFNEWKTSKEDIVYYLASQQGWNNSTEADRVNTVEAIRKRMWDIAKQQNEQQPTQEEQHSSPEFGAKSEAENWGVIYWRASGDENSRIETQADPFSPEAVSLRARQSRYQSLQAMNSYDIALSLSSGFSLYGETAMRDLATYDPAKYQEVQAELKKIQAWDTVNAIASWEHGSATTQVDNATNVINDSIDRWTQSNSNERTYDQVQETLTNKLSNNQTATSATQEMINIKGQLADLEEELANLPKTVKNQFKGDVPQYIIDAKVANEGQRIQSEINKLQSKYNWMLDLYKLELSNSQWEAEMELKQKEYNFKVNQQNWENSYKIAQQQWENDFNTRQQNRTEYYQGQSLLLNSNKIKTDKDGKPYVINDDWTYTYLTDATYQQLVEEQVRQGVETLNATWYDWMDGGQCEEFSDSWTNSVYWQTMLPVDSDGNIIQGRDRTYGSEKVQYVNTAIPKQGVVAIFKYPNTAHVSNSAMTYWHTMIVTGYDPTTGMITLKWSNRTWDELVYTKQMSLEDFRTKYYGAGFWDPTKPTWFQKTDDQVVDTTTNSISQMNNLFQEAIDNAETQWAKDNLSLAWEMYEIMDDLKNDGSLEELISTTDFQKWLKSQSEKNFSADDTWWEFLNVLRQFATKKGLSTKSKKALNRLQLLVEWKLRQESGAAISSSEWMSNFAMMVPATFEDEEEMRNVLQNWDYVIRKYARAGWMKNSDYIPIFDEKWMKQEREIFPG